MVKKWPFIKSLFSCLDWCMYFLNIYILVVVWSPRLLSLAVHTYCDNELLCFNQSTIFVVGAGGFGGKRNSDKVKVNIWTPMKWTEINDNLAWIVANNSVICFISFLFSPEHGVSTSEASWCCGDREYISGPSECFWIGLLLWIDFFAQHNNWMSPPKIR